LILQSLVSAKEQDSPGLAKKFKVDEQKIVGAIKSLEALGDVVNTQIYQVKSWKLTGEGEEVVQSGSHEARLFNLVPAADGGIDQAKLMGLCGKWGKIGFSKAMSAGWITIDKSQGSPVVKRKVGEISDNLKQDLQKIKENKSELVDEKLKVDYKKRKLVEEVNEKHYKITPGTNFTTTITKAPTELTPEMLSSGAWKTTSLKPYNLEALGVETGGGCLHPLLKVRTEYRQIFLEMGFSEMPANNFVESSFWNFDALFQPQQHPARDAHDTFFISDPATSDKFPKDYMERVKKVHSEGGFGSQGYNYNWKIQEASKNLLRTHTTAVSARMLYRTAQAGKFVPQKLFSIDRVFRNETLDATHLAEFHQIEGVVADYNITLGHCLGVINTFFTKLGIEKLRFKPAYNPYTEPSMEIFSYHEGLQKWVEIGNSGMFRPEMLLPMGLPDGVNVIGFGLSLERPTMIKYKIDNIRDLVGHKVNLDMVKKNPLCRIDKSGTGEERRLEVVSKRWARIESRLECIQKHMQALGVSTTGSVSSGAAGAQLKDFVIKVHPDKPLYSLALLVPALKKRFKLALSTHCHSSVKQPGPLILNEDSVGRSDADLKVALIYSNVQRSTLIVGSTEIQGEENILRYFCRLMDDVAASGLYDTLDVNSLAQVDTILDRLTDTSKHNISTLIPGILNKSRFLAGNNLTLADILAYSLCKQNNVTNASIQAWSKKVETSVAN